MLRVALFLAVTIQCAVAGCPDGWVEFRDFCFIFKTQAVNWETAAATCDGYGGRLVQIESNTKQNWLVNEIKARKLGETWIGGSRTDAGTWQWIPSKKPFNVYTNWGPGEPNGGASERCLDLYVGHDYKWNDANCLRQFSFVCEKRIKST